MATERVPTRSPDPPAAPPHRIAAPARWSRRRKVLSALVLVVVCGAAAAFAGNAASSPFTLWTRALQCYGGRLGERTLYPLQASEDLGGLTGVQIVSIESRAWSGARAPEYWIVPGPLDRLDVQPVAGAPDGGWALRERATGGSLSAAAPATLVVQLFPRDGRALLAAVQVTYRTPDGLLHTEFDTTRMEVDATGRCSRSTGT